MLLKLLSVAPSNIQLDMLSNNVRPFRFDVHYFDRGRIINGIVAGALYLLRVTSTFLKISLMLYTL